MKAAATRNAEETSSDLISDAHRDDVIEIYLKNVSKILAILSVVAPEFQSSCSIVLKYKDIIMVLKGRYLKTRIWVQKQFRKYSSNK